MTEHYIETHQGKDHISSDDARAQWACLLGKGRHVVSGWQEELALSVPSQNTLRIGRGFALIDGGFYRVSGAGEMREIPPGSIGMNRMDRVYLEYTRGADDIEDMKAVYEVGNPTTGTPYAPANQHPGDIQQGDSRVWIPLGDVPISGLTVGKPVMLLGKRALSPPAQQCADCAQMQQQMANALARQEAATAAAWEVVRAVPAELKEMRNTIADMRADQVDFKRSVDARINQLSAMMANNVAAYVMVDDTLAVPTAWLDYDADAQSAMLKYTSYNEETGVYSIDSPLTIDDRVTEAQEQGEQNAADVAYALMLLGYTSDM